MHYKNDFAQETFMGVEADRPNKVVNYILAKLNAKVKI